MNCFSSGQIQTTPNKIYDSNISVFDEHVVAILPDRRIQRRNCVCVCVCSHVEKICESLSQVRIRSFKRHRSKHAQAWTHTNSYFNKLYNERAVGESTDSTMRKQILAWQKAQPETTTTSAAVSSSKLSVCQEVANRAADRVGLHSVSEEMHTASRAAC